MSVAAYLGSMEKISFLLIFSIFAAVLLIYLANSSDAHQQFVFKKNEISFVSALSKPDGTSLGEIYVTYLSKPVFTSLFVSTKTGDKNIIIYKINKDGFFNTSGREQAISNFDFYGYEYTRIGKADFIVRLLTDNGKSVSDDFTISWNNDKNTFEIQKPRANDFPH